MDDFDVLKNADNLCKTRQTWVQQAYEFKAIVAPYAQVIKAILRMSGNNVWAQMWSENIEIHMNVDDMQKVTPLLLSLEDVIGKEFGKSEDETVYQISRTFKMDNFPLSVIAHVNKETDSGGEKCKAVQVGEKIVPVYEIRCDDEVKTPAAIVAESSIIPDDGIPF